MNRRLSGLQTAPKCCCWGFDTVQVHFVVYILVQPVDLSLICKYLIDEMQKGTAQIIWHLSLQVVGECV